MGEKSRKCPFCRAGVLIDDGLKYQRRIRENVHYWHCSSCQVQIRSWWPLPRRAEVEKS